MNQLHSSVLSLLPILAFDFAINSFISYLCLSFLLFHLFLFHQFAMSATTYHVVRRGLEVTTNYLSPTSSNNEDHRQLSVWAVLVFGVTALVFSLVAFAVCGSLHLVIGFDSPTAGYYILIIGAIVDSIYIWHCCCSTGCGRRSSSSCV